jgi:tRNA (cmo5U34)-methyltransferase
MSLEQTDTNRPIHFPAHPDKFGFDAEVSRIFPDMAARSIPNFYESHAAHARMLRPFIGTKDSVFVLDIGASRGAFFKALKDEYGDDLLTTAFVLHALDNSEDMCELLSKDFPSAWVAQEDITKEGFLRGPRECYDVVCLHYVLQFIPIEDQGKVLRAAMDKVRPGGILIFGHKSQHYDLLGKAAHEEYIRFRMDNGYTREEIEAKTKALTGTMFPVNHSNILSQVEARFSMVQETFRFMMFSTFMAVK